MNEQVSELNTCITTLAEREIRLAETEKNALGFFEDILSSCSHEEIRTSHHSYVLHIKDIHTLLNVVMSNIL